MKDKKKISVIVAAINAYLGEEAVGMDMPSNTKQAHGASVSFWQISGRQEMMQMRSLWQRRIVSR